MIKKILNKNSLIYEKYIQIIDNQYLISESDIRIYNKNVNIYVYDSIVFYEINKLKERLLLEFKKINKDLEKVEIKISKKNNFEEQKEKKEENILKNKEEISIIENKIKNDISNLNDEKIKRHLENITFQYINSEYINFEKCIKCNSKTSILKDGICIFCLQKEMQEKFSKACENILNDTTFEDNSLIYQQAREQLSEQLFNEILNLPEVLNLNLNNKEVDLKIIKYIKIKSGTKDNRLITEETIRVKKYIERIIMKNVKR